MSGALTFAKESGKFALMSIYEQRMNRSIHKNLATLRELQAERISNYEQDRHEEVTIARANDMKGLPYKAPAWPGRAEQPASDRRKMRLAWVSRIRKAAQPAYRRSSS